MEGTTETRPERHVQVDKMTAEDVGKHFRALHPTMTGPPCADLAWQRQCLKQLPVDALVLLGQKTRSLKKARKDHEEAEAENDRLRQVATDTQHRLVQEQELTKKLQEEKVEMQKKLNAAEEENKNLASRLEKERGTKVEAKKRKTDENSSSKKKKKTSDIVNLPFPKGGVITDEDLTPKKAKDSHAGKIIYTPDSAGYWLVLREVADGLELAKVESRNGDEFQTPLRFGKRRWRVHRGSRRHLLRTMPDARKWLFARAERVAKQGLLVSETWEVYPQKEKK